MNKQPAIYMVTNRKNGVLYTGVTSHLIQRIWQHKQHVIDGFTKRYNVDKLVYFELHNSMENAINREKQIKSGSRVRKVSLIEKSNPEWRDLYNELLP